MVRVTVKNRNPPALEAKIGAAKRAQDKKIERQFLRSLKIDRKAEAASKRAAREAAKAAKAEARQLRRTAIETRKRQRQDRQDAYRAKRLEALNKLQAEYKENEAKVIEMFDKNPCGAMKPLRRICQIDRKMAGKKQGPRIARKWQGPLLPGKRRYMADFVRDVYK